MNRSLRSASRITCRSSGANARSWTLPACWTGPACGGGLANPRRQKGDRLISHELDPRSVSAPSEIVSKSQCR